MFTACVCTVARWARRVLEISGAFLKVIAILDHISLRRVTSRPCVSPLISSSSWWGTALRSCSLFFSHLCFEHHAKNCYKTYCNLRGKRSRLRNISEAWIWRHIKKDRGQRWSQGHEMLALQGTSGLIKLIFLVFIGESWGPERWRIFDQGPTAIS